MRQTFKMHFVAAALHKIIAETKMAGAKTSKTNNDWEMKLKIVKKSTTRWMPYRIIR